jgi:uncharacterized protein
VAALYFDPSALVKRYIWETGTAWVEQSVDPGAGNEPFVSALAGPEMVATLVRRARSNRPLARQLPRLLTLLRVEWAILFTIRDVDRRAIAESMRIAESYGLRGADAVHLAVALLLERERRASTGEPIIFVSADRDQLAAAVQEGLQVDDPNRHL